MTDPTDPTCDECGEPTPPEDGVAIYGEGADGEPGYYCRSCTAGDPCPECPDGAPEDSCTICFGTGMVCASDEQVAPEPPTTEPPLTAEQLAFIKLGGWSARADWVRSLVIEVRYMRELVVELRALAEVRGRGCACGDDEACAFVRERDEARDAANMNCAHKQAAEEERDAALAKIQKVRDRLGYIGLRALNED